MKIKFKYKNYGYISDDSREIDEKTIFCQTSQNSQFVEKAKEKSGKIITIKELIEILNINNIKIVGVTGTNGKTTVTAGIYSILLDLGKKVALQGTRGFFINEEKIEGKSLTTPPILKTLFHLYQAKERGCEYFIMEVSSHSIKQKRIEGLNFALRVFTNISQDHLDYHKSMLEYKNVKSSFFKNDDLKLINKDGGNIEFSFKNCYTYALEVPASFKVNAYSLRDGITAVIQHFKEQEVIISPLVGLFNLYNILASIASVKLLTSLPLKEICEKASNFAGVSGRMEIISEKPLIIVDFAHTPDGMKSVLTAMNNHHLSVVFGAGGNRDREKRLLMGKMASTYAKKIYLTSDNPRDEEPLEIINDIKKGIKRESVVRVNPNRREAIYQAIEELQENEILLILGKGDEETQEIKGKFYPFDDRVVVKEYLSNR